MIDSLEQAIGTIADNAAAVDAAAALPLADIDTLARVGLLQIAPCAADRELARDAETLGRVLSAIGGASLTVGRLFEGHVNAVRLIDEYGDARARDIRDGEIAAGRLMAVWNAEAGDGPCLERVSGGWSVFGRKVHCSGAGHVRRPVVTARLPGGAVLMLLPDMEGPGVSIDASVWRASGMRGTATSTVVFEGTFVGEADVIGQPGDYYRAPLFSGGAWRVLAVQHGALGAILAIHADRLRTSGRAEDPIFRARFASAAAGYEAVRLVIAEAGRRAEGDGDPSAINAYVDQARGLFETVALAGIEAARRNVGLASFIAPDPLDRLIRDLETYLRQPFLDASRDSAARWLLAHKGVFPQ